MSEVEAKLGVHTKYEIDTEKFGIKFAFGGKLGLETEFKYKLQQTHSVGVILSPILTFFQISLKCIFDELPHVWPFCVQTKTSIGFSLSDPDIGDLFTVAVYMVHYFFYHAFWFFSKLILRVLLVLFSSQDPKYLTYIFVTESGASMCPWEPNTGRKAPTCSCSCTHL